MIWRSAIFFVLIAASCSQPGEADEHNPSICSYARERSLAIPESFADQYKAMDECVVHWSARLSRAPDPAPIVVDAVMGACRETFPALSRFAASEGIVFDPVETESQMREQALFRVVQSRAGHCRLPDEAEQP